MLSGKKILLGVTGSIAAYKSAFLVRELIRKGAEVKVVMTASASDFITPLTLSTLSKNPVLTEFTKEGKQGEWNNHVELALWADAFVIAPASANTMAKMVQGICDNLLMAVYLSAKCPVFFAPAMDLDMYKHKATLQNIEQLKKNGNHLINPGSGELASGLVGEGRMAEPTEIAEQLENHFTYQNSLKGKTFLVTAGPTFEELDPVRFIGNHSSGKMGYCIAEEAANRGARVILVSGPVSLSIHHPAVVTHHVVSAEEMLTECLKYSKSVDAIIMAAAVADYKPAKRESKKMKKKSDKLTLELVPTSDILKTLGMFKKKKQLLVGFALETNNEEENAKKKIESKNLDFIVLNSLKDEGAGFKGDTNKITIIDKHNKTEHFELKTKKEVASDILNKVAKLLHV